VFVTLGAFSLAQVRRQKLRSGSGIKRSDCPSRPLEVGEALGQFVALFDLVIRAA
jgi:hypothetical protein